MNSSTVQTVESQQRKGFGYSRSLAAAPMDGALEEKQGASFQSFVIKIQLFSARNTVFTLFTFCAPPGILADKGTNVPRGFQRLEPVFLVL